jgi:histone H3/H4
MILKTLHPEDVKAAIRKRYGSVARFVAAKNLPTTGVSDLFRGRTSKRVSEAVEEVLSESMKMDRSAGRAKTHRQNAGAK